MPFKVLRGTYHVVGFAPDGDSIRFMPEAPDQLLGLENVPSKLQPDRPVQLRIEAIDTLETHYQLKAGGEVHQPDGHAHLARVGLMGFLGITDVKWSPDGRKVVSANDGTRGYILARTFERYGRVVAFVFAGDPPDTATDVVLKTPLMKDSFNYAALVWGLAYPTFYEGLFADLRMGLAEAAAEAREAKRGLYADDRTGDGFAVDSLADLTDKHVIMPKLFRRLAEYVAKAGSAAGFKAVLEAAREPVLDLREGANFTHFDTFIAETGTTIQLTRHPEELVFDPKVPSSTEKIASMMHSASIPAGNEPGVFAPIAEQENTGLA